MDDRTGAPRWAVVVPVKRLAVAKTRLTRLAGAHRQDLALAFAVDTVTAALACPVVDGVVVVTDDERAADEVRAAGAVVVADEPDAGLNPALAHGAAVAARRWPGRGVVALASDLPALRPADLATALDQVGTAERVLVADAEGTGTTLLAASPGRALDPAFGHRSRAAHRAAGARELPGPGLPSLRRDVDTAVDLYDARRLGVGPRTAQVLAALQEQPGPAR